MAACEHILHRAAWIPHFDRNNSKQQRYRSHKRDQVLNACQTVLNVPGRNQYLCTERLVQQPDKAHALAVPISQHDIIDVRGVSGCIQSEIVGWEGRFDMRIDTCRAYVETTFTGEIVDNVDRLYKYGLDFLYGMLFRASFTLQPEFVATVTRSVVPLIQQRTRLQCIHDIPRIGKMEKQLIDKWLVSTNC